MQVFSFCFNRSVLYKTLLYAGILYAGITLFAQYGAMYSLVHAADTLLQGTYLAFEVLAASLFDTSNPDMLYSIIISILIGYNAALWEYYYRRVRTNATHTGMHTSIVGSIMLFLGLGCISCGISLISILIPLVGGSVLAVSPALTSFNEAVRIVGIVLLVFSIARMIHTMRKPLVCEDVE